MAGHPTKDAENPRRLHALDGRSARGQTRKQSFGPNRMNDGSEREVLSSDEWDFREVSKPELWLCWHYEFAREAVRIDSRLLRPTMEWRAGAPETFQERLKYLRQHPLISIGGWLGLLSPEWPDRSYLFLES